MATVSRMTAGDLARAGRPSALRSRVVARATRGRPGSQGPKLPAKRHQARGGRAASPTRVNVVGIAEEFIAAEKTTDDIDWSTYVPPAGYSGMDGKALLLTKDSFPTLREVTNAIPPECFEKNTAKSLMYAAMSFGLCLGTGALAYAFIPMKLAYAPLWLLYACVNGTTAFGWWLIGHECGHEAFSDNKVLQDVVGYFAHTTCLVPYFSWQRSHAVHHSRVNHMTEGESHVPDLIENNWFASSMHWTKEKYGEMAHFLTRFFIVSVGYLFYLMTGATGGPAYGVTNHLWPYWPFNNGRKELFPKKWKAKVLASAAGIGAVLAGLGAWAHAAGTPWPMLALYGGPYLVMNAWLGIVTLLHHTDTDVPHLDKEEWTWLRGAFLTIDRPYYPIVDFLQHQIGSTHVVHHICPSIPHYNARKATDAVKEAFPDQYLFDPTPVHEALYRVATKCISARKIGKLWVYTDSTDRSAPIV